METFAQRLKYARARASMSQEELAHRVGVTKSAISKCELGLTIDVGNSILFKMADVMCIDARWLATGKGPAGESAIGIPGEQGFLEAFSKLPTDVQQPIRDLVEKSAVAAEQRYWQWIAERDSR